MTLDQVNNALSAQSLRHFGGFHTTPEDGLGSAQTVILVGPSEPGFWPHFTASPEFNDSQPDPMNRWSTRVLTKIADQLGANALFPFGGPPYQPFIAWAQRSGQTWQSPAGLLVNVDAGLMVSYRGALALTQRLDLPEPPPCPCDTCKGQPCLTACPVAALGAEGYDIPACHAYLDTAKGEDCRNMGCAARRVCPVSQSYGRLPAQSAFHMKAFHG